MKAWFAIAAVVVAVLATVEVAAQAPSPAVWLRNTEQSDGAEQSTYNVTLSWQRGVVDDDHPAAESYDVYRSLIGHNRELGDYTLVGSVDVGSADVNITFTDNGVNRGGWFYYVKGRVGSMEGDPSAEEMVFAPSSYCILSTDPVLNFVTAPKTIIEPGMTYEYGAWAQHRSARVQGWVRYELIEGPDGMMVDDMNGTVTWDVPLTFDEPVHVKIRSWSLDDASAEAFQEWGIRPAEPYEILVGATTSIDEHAVLAMSIGPNPASTQLNIVLGSGLTPTTVSIVNTVGSTVAQQQTSDQNLILNVASLPSGSYILVIQREGLVQTMPLPIVR